MNSNKVKSYYQLFKPGLALNIVITEIPVFIHYNVLSFEILFYTTLGTLLCAMASFAYNQILEQNRDKMMQRTQHRYLVQYEMDPKATYIFASSLIGLGIFILGYYVNLFSMLWALFAFLNYIFIYTLWLKPRYSINTIIGGLSGAIGPFIAETAVIERITEYGIFLFILLFLWQPPHFWALVIFREDDYKKAGFVMLPLVKGTSFTIKQIYLYFFLFIICILVANFLGLVKYIFTLPTLLFTFYIIYKVRLFQKNFDISIIREVFFLTIFQNILWHLFLVLDELFYKNNIIKL